MADFLYGSVLGLDPVFSLWEKLHFALRFSIPTLEMEFYVLNHVKIFSTNASNEENMEALVEDGLAWLAAATTFTVLSIIFCFASVFLVNWSEAQQVNCLFIIVISQ